MSNTRDARSDATRTRDEQVSSATTRSAICVAAAAAKRAEWLDAAQLLLMLQGLDEHPKSPEPVVEEEPRRSKAPSPPRSDAGPRWPADLPVVEEVIDPEPVKGCPEAWRQIGEEPKPAAAG